MEMRLQKVLAQAGIASRRKAEELIADGHVEVNGAIQKQLGTRVDPGRDLIRVDGKLIESERKVYFLLYKPLETVTTLSDPQGRRTILDCMTGVAERVFAVGRLDYDAEGALIVTNDGELANRLMHPRYNVPRTYLAKVKGEPDEATIEKLRAGVTLEDGPAQPDAVELEKRAEKNTWLRLVVSEGRPHLVKRMCAAIGHPVVRLYRPSYAGLGVEGLAPGTFRPLTKEEIEALRHAGKESEGTSAPIKLPPRRHRAAEEGAAAKPAKTRSGERKSTGFLSEGGPEKRGPTRERRERTAGDEPRERRGSGFRERAPGPGGARFGAERPGGRRGAAAGGAGRAYVKRGSGGEGREKPAFGERRFAGERTGRPEGKSGFGGRGERPFGKRSPAGDRGERPFAKRSPAGERTGRPAGKPGFGERGERPFGKRSFAGERTGRPAGKPGFGERGERPSGKRSFAGERTGRPAGKPGFGERGDRPFGKRSFAGERGQRPSGKPGFGGARAGGERGREGGFGAAGARPERAFSKRGPGGPRSGSAGRGAPPSRGGAGGGGGSRGGGGTGGRGGVSRGPRRG